MTLRIAEPAAMALIAALIAAFATSATLTTATAAAAVIAFLVARLPATARGFGMPFGIFEPAPLTLSAVLIAATALAAATETPP